MKPQYNFDSLAMSRQLKIIVGVAAILAPGLHLVTDIYEWIYGEFSSMQLWLNYAAFLLVPFLLMGFYAVHYPRMRLIGLLGALLYGMAFIYFAHTTLFALSENIPTYEVLLSRLGSLYPMHGGLMIVGGMLFGFAALQANYLPRWTVLLFLCGITTHLIVAIISDQDVFQTVGSSLRNMGLMGMGLTLLQTELMQK
jgi:hypothetical protein